MNLGIYFPFDGLFQSSKDYNLSALDQSASTKNALKHRERDVGDAASANKCRGYYAIMRPANDRKRSSMRTLDEDARLLYVC